MASSAADIDSPEFVRRCERIAAGAAQWRDPKSWVRRESRERLRDGIWSAPVVEAALDAALWDLDLGRATELVRRYDRQGASALVILPGNVLGPAITSAYCAAVAGARAILKPAQDERHLADVVVQQFEELGTPLASTIESRHWRGGDERLEGHAFSEATRVIVFGGDEAVQSVRSRIERPDRVVEFADAFSIGVVGPNADVRQAARGTAIDVCMFDQRGCMSPQTIYVAGPHERAIIFGQALARALAEIDRRLPRARPAAGEQAALADLIRLLSASVLDSPTHGLGTLIVDRRHQMIPSYVIAVEPFGSPRCAGFGRVVSVRPFAAMPALADVVKAFGRPLDTVGVGGAIAPADTQLFGAQRVCALGEMQRPPFGYRPSPADFIDRNA